MSSLETLLHVRSLTTSNEVSKLQIRSGEFQGNLALAEFPGDFALNEFFRDFALCEFPGNLLIQVSNFEILLR